MSSLLSNAEVTHFLCVEAKANATLFRVSCVLLLVHLESIIGREVLGAVDTLEQLLLGVLRPDVPEKILLVGHLDLVETIAEAAVDGGVLLGCVAALNVGENSGSVVEDTTAITEVASELREWLFANFRVDMRFHVFLQEFL